MFLVKYTEANRIHFVSFLGFWRIKAASTAQRRSPASPLIVSVLGGRGHDDAVRTSGPRRSAEFSFAFPSRAEDTRGRGLLFRWPHHSWEGGGSFSEESPSDISEVASVAEDDNVDLAVQHGRDGERLSFTGLQEHTTQASQRLPDERGKRKRVVQTLLRFHTFTVSCCLGLRLSGTAMVNLSFPLSSSASAFCSGRN